MPRLDSEAIDFRALPSRVRQCESLHAAAIAMRPPMRSPSANLSVRRLSGNAAACAQASHGMPWSCQFVPRDRIGPGVTLAAKERRPVRPPGLGVAWRTAYTADPSAHEIPSPKAAVTQALVTDELLSDITRRIVERVHPRRIVLSGNRARGDTRADSDIDLFIEMESRKRPSERASDV
jgi:hypothetical protein